MQHNGFSRAVKQRVIIGTNAHLARNGDMRSILLVWDILMDFIVIVWHLLLLRTKPQNMPAYRKLLVLSCAFMLCMGALSALAIGVTRVNPLEAIVDLIFLLAFLKVLLWLFRFPNRFTQTAIAITGSTALFSVLFIPLNFMAASIVGFGEQASATAQSSPAGAVIALVYLALFIWMLRVLGHIFYHALEVRLPFALGIAMLYLMSSLFVSLMVL